MKILKYILGLGALLALSCTSDVNVNIPNFPNFPPGSNNCLPGQGAIVSETRTLADFNSINSTIFADVIITQGPKEAIRIEGQQNIIDQIETDVVNDELRLSLNRCVNIREAVKVHITIPEIRELTLTGVGNVSAQNEWDLTDLKVVLTGVGNFNLQGTATTLDIMLTGVGDIKAFDLKTDSCEVAISGTGNAEVFVNNELEVTITGSGSVFYKGTPTINSNITGVGSVVDAN